MNLDKADVKIGTANELGCRIEDILEGAKKDVSRQEGAASALHQATKAIEALGVHVDKDMDEGKYDPEVAGHIKRYVERSANVVRTLAKQAEAIQLVAQGKVMALETSVKVVEKFRSEEQAKAETLRQALANGVVKSTENGLERQNGVGSLGVRPGASIKERRLAEEAVERAAAEASQAPAAPPPPAKARRGKKRAANA